MPSCTTSCIHKTLRTTPAIAARIEKRLWSMEDVVALIDEHAERTAPPAGGSVGRMTRLLLLAGVGCAILVVLTHVAERFAILPGMGWGLPDSPGHYLDLSAAISGVALFLGAAVAWLLRSK